MPLGFERPNLSERLPPKSIVDATAIDPVTLERLGARDTSNDSADESRSEKFP